MLPRDRLLTALHHEEPDRVPLALWGSYYTLQDETYVELLEHLGLGDPVAPFRRFKNRNSNYIDDRVLDALGTDVRYVWSGFTDLGGARPDTGRDAWGVGWERTGAYMTAAHAPLAGATTEDLASYPWPDPDRYLDLDALRARVHKLEQRATHAITARAVNSFGPFEQACILRGREQFMMDLALDPEFARGLIDRVTDVIVQLQDRYLDAAGQAVDVMEIPGDDYAGTEALLVSPATFAELLEPALRRIVQPIKEYRDDLFVAFHSDGAVESLLPRFIDIGIDLFHPLEPLSVTDLAAIKTKYGARLSFMGSIDIKEAMTGTEADVDAEVRRRLQALAPGGGYVLAPANHLQPDVPPENVIALYDSARKWGTYPIA